MADSAIGLERTFDSSVYTPAAAPADLPSLLRLAAKKQELGEDAEAEELFRRALELADGTLAADDPDFVLLLTDLSRLYLKKSAFASAEPILLRLFEIKRGKGEDHPEVATVLASLATVRQALGRHESAEQLWRRVLEIRERTLAPNHFAIATALEHLGVACGARGKIAEALSAFQRALSIREKTMGVEHPSLRASRERIADLQLQGSEDSFDIGIASDVVVAPEKYRLLSGDTPTITPSEALSLIAPRMPDRAPALTLKKPSAMIQAKFADREVATVEKAVPAKPASDEAVPISAILPNSSGDTLEPALYLDTLASLRDEMEQPYESRSLMERSGELFGAMTNFLSKKEAIVGMVAVVIGGLSLAVVTSSPGLGARDQLPGITSVAAAESPRTAPVTPVNLTTSDAAALALAADNAAKANAAAHLRAAEDHSAAARKTPEKKAETKVDTKPLAIPALSTSVMSSLESVATKAASGSPQGTESMLQTAVPLVSRRSGFSESQADAVPLRARLIGDLPTPRVPAQVADVEGEVRVRFSVDVEGRPMMSTLEVINSPNALLTTAVRKVIPAMRFEPARTGGADPKAITDVVQIGFQFSKGR